MADEIGRLSDELASDPGSLAFLRLGELLRQRGELDAADRVATRGRDRHPGIAAAHDLAARVALDRGESPKAVEAWSAVLKLEPTHVGAHKGLGFVAYRQGRMKEAERHLADAAMADPNDTSIKLALSTVRNELQRTRPTPPAGAIVIPAPVEPPPARRSSIGMSLFADLSADTETVLLVDKNGLVLAGSAPIGGVDRSAEIGAHLSGISEEADRAMRHLELGAWTAIVIEGPATSAALSPAGAGGLVMVTAPHATPLGLLRRLLARASERGARVASRGGRVTTQFTPILATVMRHRGVTGCLLVDEHDGVIIDSTLQFGMRGNVFAALIASLYRKSRQSASAAGMGEATFVQLDAERGRVCAVGRDGMVLIAVADVRANLGLLRVDLLKARENLA